ncbi:MAG: GlyGly-CTERM sorting domain-containing protein [Sulfurimonas sp.]
MKQIGFFGMNTSGLPFTAGEEGTMKVVWSMGFVTLLTLLIVILWRKKTEETEA